MTLRPSQTMQFDRRDLGTQEGNVRCEKRELDTETVFVRPVARLTDSYRSEITFSSLVPVGETGGMCLFLHLHNGVIRLLRATVVNGSAFDCRRKTDTLLSCSSWDCEEKSQTTCFAASAFSYGALA